MLNELVTYSEMHLPDSEPGFKTRNVRWRVELAANGSFLGVLPLGDARKGESLARCPDMHGMNAGGKAHFLVETAQTAVLLLKDDEERNKVKAAKERHGFYAKLMRQAAKQAPGLSLIADCLHDASRLGDVRAALAEKKAKPSDWLVWRVNGKDPRDQAEVQQWWRTWRKADLQANSATNGKMVCFLTGEPSSPLATHPKITGLSVVGGLAMGDVMVGFDKAAFGSFSLDQSANAAMSAEAVQKYVDGLNDLLRNHAQKLANALVVHWFKDRVDPKDDPLLAFLQGFETEEQTEVAALAEVRRLLQSIRTGQRADLGQNRYYAMTISGAAGRVMVRDWMEGRFEDLVESVEAWFSDLDIIARDGKGKARAPKFLAVCGALVRELKDLPAPTAAILWRVAVKHLPIPQPLMAQALDRFRAELLHKDQAPFNHARLGLLKAYFVRKQEGSNPNMKPYLNPDHPEPAYHCGRLLAVLAGLQRAALGDVGAGVVQRYYPAASQTPGLILGRLVSNARNHLSKLDPGLAWWYEERIAEIMSRLQDRAPRTVDLEGQGLFALGYYQQIAALRAGKKTPDTNSEEEETK